jgi:hypothetical protein
VISLTGHVEELVRLRAERDEALAERDNAIAAERHRIGAWLRERVGSWSANSVEHGDHIDDDAPPLPSLRSLMLLRDELLRQVAALTTEVKP